MKTRHYLLDTSIYGVLIDEHEPDYDIVQKTIGYAKSNREHFVTTLIISKELSYRTVNENIRRVILPEYYSSVSVDRGVLEITHSDKYELAEKLAWNYIQRLEKKDADMVMDDALNYAWASVAGIEVFVTRNRRGVLADSYRPVLKKSNKKMRCKFVELMQPNEFYETLI